MLKFSRCAGQSSHLERRNRQSQNCRARRNAATNHAGYRFTFLEPSVEDNARSVFQLMCERSKAPLQEAIKHCTALEAGSRSRTHRQQTSDEMVTKTCSKAGPTNAKSIKVLSPHNLLQIELIITLCCALPRYWSRVILCRQIVYVYVWTFCSDVTILDLAPVAGTALQQDTSALPSKGLQQAPSFASGSSMRVRGDAVFSC